MLGLFTSKAYAEPASTTPLLHRKLRQIVRSEDLMEGSHDFKRAVELFNSFPKDELLSAPTADLRRAVVALLSLEGDRVRLLGRRSSDKRSVSLIAALPAARYDAELLDAFADLLRERFGTARGRHFPEPTDPRHRHPGWPHQPRARGDVGDRCLRVAAGATRIVDGHQHNPVRALARHRRREAADDD
jgi:NAD-specific glutamate dehydrogenase